MRPAIVKILFVATIVALTASCKPLGLQKNILDAAKLYQNNKTVFDSIRQHFPGPYYQTIYLDEDKASENTPEDMAFLRSFQSKVPVESITLYWLDSRDVIVVAIASYGLSVSGTSVNLLYYESGGPNLESSDGAAIFDSCDHRSIEWLSEDRGAGLVTAYCRINEHWYAEETWS